ncbi:PDZ domain-containing protein [Leptospira borgpetersenii]|uniref:PDZ domain-containing protein n=1 Tax=Leptospira borgpetersenii TaxID=174 RepID=UPI0018805A3E|nr:serine protease [Leptospira borgpetersenii]MBE8365198.1 serine protease [Leptospira borgpetersenii serovar Balcanica]MBE8367136.1 serine protease [Leptospira borgpetersenii serovar Balcanica]MBE8424287.1 serine protease [Leptospira borgpetersenii serovar Balcanica]MBF3351391.1 serine protease [Leptospira borgpetersenii serovar Balcanica]
MKRTFSKLTFPFFQVCISVLWSLTISGPLKAETILVHFRKFSHQNPWQKGLYYERKVPAIITDRDFLLALLSPGELPLFSETNPETKPGTRLYLFKHDPETGLALFSHRGKFSAKRKSRFGNSRYSPCSKFFPKPEWESPDLSNAIMKISRPSGAEGSERKFLYSKNMICGYTDGNWNIPVEYLFLFLHSSSSNPIVHPGFSFDDALTIPEKKFYFPDSYYGVVVSEVYPGVGPVHNLFPGDAIYSINGENFTHPPDRQEVFSRILTKNQHLILPGSIVTLGVFRAGKRKEVTYSLKNYTEDSFFIPSNSGTKPPSYLISGGLFFTELTGSYLKESGDQYRENSDKKLLYLYESFNKKIHPEKNRLVFISRVFPDPANQGFHDFQDQILESVNNKTVRSLSDLKKILNENQDEYIVFRFSGNRIAAFSREQLQSLNSKILSNYNLDKLDNLP